MKSLRLIIAICLLALTHHVSATPAPAVDPAIIQSISQKATANWNEQDSKDFRNIFASVANGSQDVTLTDRKRFWAILDKMNATPQEMAYFLRTLTSALFYREHLFQDALVAYKHHAPYRSPQRAGDEAFLLAEATGPSARKQAQTAFRRKTIAANNKMIANIAARKPIFLADTGETVVFDDQRLKDTQLGFAIIHKRLLLLLKHP